MIERYTRPAMGRIWTEETKYRCWLEVEAAASTVLAEDGVIPAAAAEAIAKKATVSAARVAEIEEAIEQRGESVVLLVAMRGEAVQVEVPAEKKGPLGALELLDERRELMHLARANLAGRGIALGLPVGVDQIDFEARRIAQDEARMEHPLARQPVGP